MQITSQQRNKLLVMFQAYDSRVSSLRAQRIQVVESLKRSTSGGEGGSTVDNLHLMMERYLTLFDSSGKLAATPDSELMAMIDFMRDTGTVWTMLQRAKMVSLAYPAFPDTVMFVKAVAEMSEEELCGDVTPPTGSNPSPPSNKDPAAEGANADGTGMELGRVAVGREHTKKPA